MFDICSPTVAIFDQKIDMLRGGFMEFVPPQQGAIPIPGAKNREQAEQNAGALGWRLTEDELQALDRLGKYGRRRLVHRFWQHG